MNTHKATREQGTERRIDEMAEDHAENLLPLQMLAVDARRLGQLLGVSIRHLERLSASGKLPKPISVGKARRWPLDGPNGLKRWLAQGCPNRIEFEKSMPEGATT